MLPLVNFSTRLTPLRFSFKSAFKPAGSSTPPLHALLPIPIQERLILLAIIDGSSPQEIKQTLGATQADLRMETPRMMLALAALTRSLREPFDSWPKQLTREDLTPDQDLVDYSSKGEVTGAYWEERWDREIERTLRQLLFAEVGVCLFGDAVPARLRDLTLEERSIAYALIVEEMEWVEVEKLLGCTEYRIRSVINKVTALLEGGK